MRKLASLLAVLSCVTCAREPTNLGTMAHRDFVVQQPTGTYDIYIYDVASGTAVQATTLAPGWEFNPAFSPNGKLLVHDVLTFEPFTHNLYITNVETHVSAPLLGGEGGNDGAWSPNGQLIAFDRSPVGDVNLYVVPARGGTPVLVRSNGLEPQWSPDGHHLAFSDFTDQSIRTIDLRSGDEHQIVPFGVNPVWSRDGRRIAYSDNNNIFVVPVSAAGVALGAPVQLTFDDPSSVFSAQPSWAGDGMSIAFSSNRGNIVDWDIWVVAIDGGEPTRLTGAPGTGDYDPAFYQKKLVAFPSFTPAL